MTPEPAVTSIAHAIALAVAPVFLLAGVGAFLNVLTTRLGRIVDRARVLHGRIEHGEVLDSAGVEEELRVLGRRVRVVNTAIGLCTVCALLVCTVVAVIFVSAFTSIGMTIPIATCFIVAMTCLVVALCAFLVEIYLATAKISIGY